MPWTISNRCRYGGPCIFRNGNECKMLKDTTSRDGRCHFQKKELDGENLYDRTERIKKKARGDEIRQLVGEMHCDGIEDKDIAEAVGITTLAVRRYLKMLEMIT